LLATAPTPRRLIGDKAYDTSALRNFLKNQGSEAVIPPTSHWKNPPAYDPILYRQRNLIKRAFNRLKDWQAIATRYDKKAANCLAAAFIWWIN
jgi:transposase